MRLLQCYCYCNHTRRCPSGLPGNRLKKGATTDGVESLELPSTTTVKELFQYSDRDLQALVDVAELRLEGLEAAVDVLIDNIRAGIRLNSHYSGSGDPETCACNIMKAGRIANAVVRLRGQWNA